MEPDKARGQTGGGALPGTAALAQAAQHMKPPGCRSPPGSSAPACCASPTQRGAARTAQRSMHSMIRTQGHKRNTTIPAKRNKKSEQGRERLTPCTLCTSLSYISLSDTSMKHLSRMPAGMKYSAGRRGRGRGGGGVGRRKVRASGVGAAGGVRGEWVGEVGARGGR